MIRCETVFTPGLGENIIFEDGRFVLIAGGPAVCPNYELVDVQGKKFHYFPSGSLAARRIVAQVEIWQDEFPMESEVTNFLDEFTGLGAMPLIGH